MSSILESLYILIKMDTEELKKGVAQTQAQVEKLESSFEDLSSSGDRVQSSLQGMLGSVTRLAAGFFSFRAILSGASGAISAVRDVSQAAREMNVDVSSLDAWSSAVERMGGSAQAFQSSLSSLAEKFGTTSTIALNSLPNIADSLSKLSPEMAQRYGKGLGLDQSTILMLQQGRREVEDLIKREKELGVVSAQDAIEIKKFDVAMHELNRTYQAFAREMTMPLIPYLRDFFQWVVDNKALVADTFETAGIAAGAAFFTAFLRKNPFTAAAAGIAGVYGLAKDDINAHAEGRPSIIGEAEELPWKIAGKVMKAWMDFTGESKRDPQGSLFVNALSYGGAPLLENTSATGRNVTVNVGDVTVNTQATDAAGISGAFVDGLKLEFDRSNAHFDNFVRR